MPGQVPVAPVMDAFQFPVGKGEIIFNIHRSFGVMGQFSLGMLPQADFLLVGAQIQIPIQSLLLPVIKPFTAFFGINEKLHFHLFKFAGPENEVAGSNFIPESLADLGNAKRNFYPCRI